MTKTCYVFSGIPGSGKSTLAEKWINHLITIDSTWCLYSTDQYIECYAESVDKTYSEVFKDQIKPAQQYMDDLVQDAMTLNINVLWDQTNLTVKKRKKIIDMMKAEGYNVEAHAIVYDNDRKALQKRLDNRPGKVIPNNIMFNMIQTYEIPSLEEGFDKCVLYDMNGKIINELC